MNWPENQGPQLSCDDCRSRHDRRRVRPAFSLVVTAYGQIDGKYHGMRRYLMLTTVRQSEQGRGCRHLPGLCPPDHVGPQPPERAIRPAQVRP